ncbi:MAG TPA: SRPBCC domain-containing protein [Chroococcales cyanobacterium]
MNDEAKFSKVCAVSFERVLPGPIEDVWDWLVNIERLPGWYGNGVLEARVGGAVNLMDGHVRGVVTQIVPNQRITYTWNVFMPGQESSDYPESYLTIEVKPFIDEVLLTLNHLPVLDRFEKQNAMGWHTFLDMLAAGLRGEEVPSRKSCMERNARLYGIDLANLVK